MTLHVHNENPNAFVRVLRKVYNPAGFKKGYNFTLFFIFAGAFFGFALARLNYLDIRGTYFVSTAPGEAYWPETFTRYRVGISIHLGCIIPAALLVVWQFLPIIRYKALIFHRINGWTVSALLILGNVGALMIARRSFGGGLDVQAWVGLTVIMTTTSTILAIINIKRLQIDQHRAWMLRTWFYAGSIITIRIIMVISALIISTMGSYYLAMPCEVIESIDGPTLAYAACAAGGSGHAIVNADIGGEGLEQLAASFEISFGMASWMALALHAIGVEIYLNLTPVEGERLRQVSYERQLERGFKNPGSAGWTSDRWGDAEPWVPRVKVEERKESA